MTTRVRTLAAFEDEAARFARALAPRTGGATVVTLAGELGAGKTAFVKAAARAFGVGETVQSPTFVLEKIYALPREAGTGFARLVHIDAYRLERGAELSALGFDELARDPENLVLLEWPERVREALPPPSVSITITALADGSRAIAYGKS